MQKFRTKAEIMQKKHKNFAKKYGQFKGFFLVIG